jgi:hypothetical protein
VKDEELSKWWEIEVETRHEEGQRKVFSIMNAVCVRYGASKAWFMSVMDVKVLWKPAGKV